MGWTSATIARIGYPPPKQLTPAGEKRLRIISIVLIALPDGYFEPRDVSVGETQGELRAVLHRAPGVLHQGVGDRLRVDDRVPPIVEVHALGEELRADAVRLAFDRVDHESHGLHCQLPSDDGIGKGAGGAARQRPSRS